MWRRWADAISAASVREMADPFLRAVLNVNLAFGANAARVSLNFSDSALIAWGVGRGQLMGGPSKRRHKHVG